MPDLPCTTRAQMQPGGGYLAMASHLPLKRISFTGRFFRGVAAVRKQLATADGPVGYTLRARPLARDYWTLSVWKDEPALRQFMPTPHVKLMTSLKPGMGPTYFVAWTIAAARRPATMTSALEHLTNTPEISGRPSARVSDGRNLATLRQRADRRIRIRSGGAADADAAAPIVQFGAGWVAGLAISSRRAGSFV